MNELSLICRVIGNLFYRKPLDPQLAPLYESIITGRLIVDWPLKQDELLKRWQDCKLTEIDNEYERLFTNILITDIFADEVELKGELQHIVTASKIPISLETQIYHYGFIWLLLSWLEAQRAIIIDSQDTINQSVHEQSEQIDLLEELIRKVFFIYLKPMSKAILGNLEVHTQHDFYKVLAIITRELIAAIDEEYSEELNSVID